jgi:elongation factor Ts
MSTVNISPKDVMKLRDRTGLGMGDCKNALVEANGDFDAAEKLIRERMKGKMDARTDRAAGEGCIAVAFGGGKAAIVELRSETDFTARNEEFRAMAADVAKIALGAPAGALAVTQAITDRVDEVRLKTGENISLARGTVLEGGSFAHYLHHDHKLGVVLKYEGNLPEDVGVGICQHVAAHVPTPAAIDEHGLDAATVAAKRAEAVAEAQASGKPAQIAEKMAEGKMRKYFEEVTLLGQNYVRDDKMQVGQIVPKDAKLVQFVRMRLGQE